ncbi:hypothetical protein [Mycolicibacterium brisbanense]|uniref:Uncharacterized protein n=1 Tax=Mycolicibacterium brisbanense TaxID=146020 RepID=A0A117I850_9MYCO|nr:hypothetical protein [Mycolicibacterium brisbanense]MCV7158037.1 hypothetical protein [Mycolicibacterium brisbanense]GAS92687.1 uncharacterized protein RMCB_6783 [Mycolicibacterium brisbanense]
MKDLFRELGIPSATLARALAVDAGVHAALEAKANEAVEYWKGIAPVFSPETSNRSTPPHGEPGDYRDSVHVEWRQGELGPYARIASHDYKAVWIEFGAEHMPEFACASRTCLAMGGDGKILHESIEHAQGHLRNALKELARVRATGSARDIAAAAQHVSSARQARSAAFRVLRSERRSRSGGRRRR